MEITEVLRHGIITEKSVQLQQTPRQGKPGEFVSRYTFKVAREANKYQIKEAVEAMFGVKVVKVNTITMPGKEKVVRTRTGFVRREARPWKKAIVTLADGQTIAELQA